MDKDSDICFPFSGHEGMELRGVFEWLVEVDKDHGMAVEALDAFLGNYKETGNLAESVWFSNCEWDL